MSITIVVPLDGSPLAEQALRVAVALASRERARLVLVRAVPAATAAAYGDPHAQRAVAARAQSDQATAEAELAAVAERLQHDAVSVRAHVTTADVASAIVAAVAEEAADLIVMTTHAHGRSRQWPCGRVAEAVLGRVPVPCMLVPPEDQQPWPTDRPPRVLLTLDESETAEAMPERLAPLLRAFGAEVLLLRVLDPPQYVVRPHQLASEPAVVEADVAAARARIEHMAEPLGAALGRPVGTHVAVSPYSGSTIAEVAREHQADLIALGLRGDAGGTRPPLGSVALDVLALAVCPVLLAPMPKTEGAPGQTTHLASVHLSRPELEVLVRALDNLLAREHASPVLEIGGELLAHLRELSESQHVDERTAQ
jgi:nucleotide-binding universal stress UspA family protein